MRLLNEQEQEWCRRILQGDGFNNYLANILNSDLPDAKIHVDKQQQRAWISYMGVTEKIESISISLKERDPQIRRLILEAVTLIKLLEQEGYIMLFMSASQAPNFSIGAGPDKIICNDAGLKLYEITSDIKDPSVVNLLAEYSSKAIYVTEEFRAFCENGYIPRLDVQFNQNLELTRQSLEQSNQSLELTKKAYRVAVGSFLIAIATLILTFYLAKCQ